MASAATTTPADTAFAADGQSVAERSKAGRSRGAPVEYRVVSVTVRGSKAAVIARLLELTPPSPEGEAAR